MCVYIHNHVYVCMYVCMYVCICVCTCTLLIHVYIPIVIVDTYRSGSHELIGKATCSLREIAKDRYKHILFPGLVL